MKRMVGVVGIVGVVGLLSGSPVRAQVAGQTHLEIKYVRDREEYWTLAQQLAHLTTNGASTRPGDLYASGTVSGPTRGSEGSLIELTRNGTEPLQLPTGEELRSSRLGSALAGLTAMAAYGTVLFVMGRGEPASYVGAVREVSVVFGAVFGVLFLGEKGTLMRVLGSVLITCGVGAIATLG